MKLLVSLQSVAEDDSGTDTRATKKCHPVTEIFGPLGDKLCSVYCVGVNNKKKQTNNKH